jgi:hypothetical protein
VNGNSREWVPRFDKIWMKSSSAWKGVLLGCWLTKSKLLLTPCFFDGAKIIIATSGFQKKSQKTPKREIDTAHKRQRDYYRGTNK